MISVVKMNETDKWNDLVKSFNEYDVYYLSEYAKTFYIHGDGDPILIHYENEGIRAINVVMIRDIEKDTKFSGKILPKTFFDITTPYGYGGFLIEGEITEDRLRQLDHEYTLFCTNQGIICEFVRFHPITCNSKKLVSVYDVQTLGNTVAIHMESREQMWDDFENRNRTTVRKAQKNGIKIYWGRNPELFEEFIEIYNSTMDKDNATNYYYFGKEFYNSILYDLKDSSMMFYAVYEGEIIAMMIILYKNKQLHAHLLGSKRKYQPLAPNNLLFYEIACWGSQNGYSTFHIGGGVGCKEDNLYLFKKAFSKNSENTFEIGKKIFDKEKYDKMIEIRREDAEFNSESAYFPIYRA